MRVVLHPYHPASVGPAFRYAEDLDVVIPSEETLPDALSDGILVSYQWRDEFLVDSLRWIQSISVGVDQFPLEELVARDIVLTSARGIHGPQVSEHAFALLLALTRGVGASMRNAVTKNWRPIPGVEISSMTLGVLGLGTVGEEIARKADAWGMTVVGTKSDPNTYAGVATQVFTSGDTVEVFRLADAVISVLPDLPETRGIVTRKCLDALDGGWFVNVGRGTAVDERDIIAALEAGSLAGVGLDVFDPEPLAASSPLWSHPRVVITAHSAGFSPQYGPRLLDLFRRNLEAFHTGRDWATRVV